MLPANSLFEGISIMSHASTAKFALNVGNFRELVRFCAAMEPTRYHPVRLNLKLKAIQEALASAEASLAKVEEAHAELGKVPEGDAQAHLAEERAREAMKTVLYAKGEGIVDLANDCKIYLKTLKGPKEADLHHITHLEFRAPG
jgi:hypothetical protein